MLVGVLAPTVGLVLLVSGVAKVWDLRSNTRRLPSALRLPYWFVAPLLTMSSIIEIALAPMLLLHRDLGLTLLVAGLLFLGFSVLLGRLLQSGPLSSCGCLGSRVDLRPTVFHLVLNATLGAACISLSATGAQPTAAFHAHNDPLAAFSVLLGGLYWLAVYAAMVIENLAGGLPKPKVSIDLITAGLDGQPRFTTKELR